MINARLFELVQGLLRIRICHCHILVKVLELLALIRRLESDVLRNLVYVSHDVSHILDVRLTIIYDLLVQIRLVLYLDIHRL